MPAPSDIAWFEDLTGVRETTYAKTRAAFTPNSHKTVILTPAGPLPIGDFQMPCLKALVQSLPLPSGLPNTIRVIKGDAFDLHHDPDNAGAVFQVASQFNCLEHIAPGRGLEAGLSGYARDRTQGPACALACPADLLFRHFFVQTPKQQLDGAAGIFKELQDTQTTPPWKMVNGYLVPVKGGTISAVGTVSHLSETQLRRLMGHLRVGVTWGAWVSRAEQRVTQVYCSAVPLSYFRARYPEPYYPLASMFLKGAYTATLAIAARQKARGGSGKVFLTRVGGGAFWNPPALIDAAMAHAMTRLEGRGLEVYLVERE